MRELQNFWSARSGRQRLAIIGGFAASFIMVLAFVALAGRTPKALLYAGLGDSEAAPVVSYLEQGGIPYDLRGDSIWVAAEQRDRIRMDLAAQNLPRQGGAGYEILDDMSGFSTTSQMFDAAYWRAKEGELARTILSIPSVKSARVHLTAPRPRSYRDTQTGSASVTVVMNGAELTPSQAQAMRFLISSAVPGLTPESVSVIDSVRGVIQAPEDQSVSDRETRMKANVERILTPHVGAGNAIVELSIDLVTETEQVIERSIDPSQRTMISQETEELVDESTMADAAAVTAASNLPERGEAAGEKQQSERSETRLRANYEVGSLTRQVDKAPGAIRRLSVAVLVNGVPKENANGEVELVPRTEPELASIRDLVAAAVGFDETRGDELIVRSMPFAETVAAGTAVDRSASWLERIALDSLVRLALVGLFAIIALAITLRGLRGRGSKGADARLDETTPVSGAIELPGPAESEPATASDPTAIMLPMKSADFDFDNPGGAGGEFEDPVARLRQLMKERQDETVKLLHGWIDHDERTAS